MPPATPPKKTTVWQEIASVLASFAGVQSRKNRERDFTGGNAKRFLVIGIVMTLLFVLGVYTVVQIVLKQVGL